MSIKNLQDLKFDPNSKSQNFGSEFSIEKLPKNLFEDKLLFSPDDDDEYVHNQDFKGVFKIVKNVKLNKEEFESNKVKVKQIKNLTTPFYPVGSNKADRQKNIQKLKEMSSEKKNSKEKGKKSKEKDESDQEKPLKKEKKRKSEEKDENEKKKKKN